jgi:hypothetical protein
VRALGASLAALGFWLPPERSKFASARIYLSVRRYASSAAVSGGRAKPRDECPNELHHPRQPYGAACSDRARACSARRRHSASLFSCDPCRATFRAARATPSFKAVGGTAYIPLGYGIWRGAAGAIGVFVEVHGVTHGAISSSATIARHVSRVIMVGLSCSGCRAAGRLGSGIAGTKPGGGWKSDIRHGLGVV